MNTFYRKLKHRKKLHRTQRLPKEHKRAKDTALTHVFFNFYIIYFPINFSFVTSYTEGLPPILEQLEIREPLLSFKRFLKCMAPIACIYFKKYESFQHFILPELCQEKKAYDKRWCKYYFQLFKSRPLIMFQFFLNQKIFLKIIWAHPISIF